VEDLDQPFLCQKCEDYESDKKKKMHIIRDQKVRSLIKQFKITRKEALRKYYDDIPCIFCGQGGGLMKKQSEINLPYMCKSEVNYYHLFCAFAVGKHLNVPQVTKLRVSKALRVLYNSDTVSCAICASKKGICLKVCDHETELHGHALCLWLAGYKFEVESKKLTSVESLSSCVDSKLVRNERIRRMFHASGPGSNGGYLAEKLLL